MDLSKYLYNLKYYYFIFFIFPFLLFIHYWLFQVLKQWFFVFICFEVIILSVYILNKYYKEEFNSNLIIFFKEKKSEFFRDFFMFLLGFTLLYIGFVSFFGLIGYSYRYVDKNNYILKKKYYCGIHLKYFDEKIKILVKKN